MCSPSGIPAKDLFIVNVEHSSPALGEKSLLHYNLPKTITNPCLQP